MSETTPRPSREVAAPGGSEPPAEATLDGETIDLRLLAGEVSARFIAETPAYAERYGEHAAAWCEHDCRHVLGWACSEHEGWVDLGAQVAWLARVLAARDFPLAWLARDMELAADVVAERLPRHGDALASRLREVAGEVRGSS